MLKKLLVTLVIIALVVLYASLYTVNETQKGIILRLGKIELNKQQQAKTVGPGLHIKWPFIQSVKLFDMRLRTLDIDSSRIMTAEQKDVIVDAFVKWRIGDIVQYFKSTGGDDAQASTLLRQKVNDGMRATFGQHTIPELLSNKRNAVMQQILKEVQIAAAPIGVQVLDVRIKRIDLPQEVAEKIYARMRSAREKKAALIRADGQQQAEVIRAKADAKVAVTIAQAKSQAAAIRAKGNAEAATIYANAYAQHLSFYRFYRSLEAYLAVFSGHANRLVLRPEGEFFQYFNPHVKVTQ